MAATVDVRVDWRDRITSPAVQDGIAVWALVLLTVGQGFRYLIGMPAYIALAVVTVAAVWAAFRPTLASLRLPLPLGAFVGLVAASVLWSSTRAITALAVVALIATTFLAVVTVRGTGNRRFMVILYRGFQISLLLGLALELYAAIIVKGPVYPPMSDLTDLVGGDNIVRQPLTWSDGLLFEGGPIQGFVGNRNTYGFVALLTAITAMIVLLERLVRRWEAIATLVAAGAVHLLTQSATVTVSTLYIVGITIAAFWIRRLPSGGKKTLSRIVLGLTAIAGVATIKYRDVIFGLVGRDSDLTSRARIWREVVEVAWQRPEGWGFVGYWPVWEEPYAGIDERVDLVATHAHNAFLDTWLQLGLVGVALLVTILVLMFGSSWRLVERAERGDTYLPLGWALLSVALLLQSLVESRILVEFGWYMVVALYLSGPQVFRLTIVDPDLVHHGRPSPEGDEAQADATT
ncbi:O-antigen ligase family protein [Demequina salsinemoris]|uniref:O-antigen ligase family protein n=1 Tax=Demequina salsinemoris TaxID=577470 RepID=UPI000783D4A5|nr:O-antigen ligase family protein [Demequina salsinemoris]